MPGQSAYNAAKYAVRGFTEALREEMLVAGHPVGVTCVHPGGIKTAIARNARVTAAEDDRRATASCSTRSWPGWRPTGPPRSSSRAPEDKARVLVGLDAHADPPLRQARSARATRTSSPGSANRADPPTTQQLRCRTGRMTSSPGTRSAVVMTKWGDRPHWEFDAALPRRATSTATGSGIAAGTVVHPPGRRATSRRSTRSAWSPAADAAADRSVAGHRSTPGGGPVEVYVDMTTPPVGRARPCARSTSTSTWSAASTGRGLGRRRGRVRRAPGRVRLPDHGSS